MHTSINRHVVLNLDVVAQGNARTHDHVLPNVASITDVAIGHDVGEMPDFSAFSNGAAVIDNGGFMREITHRI
jgi:hypothetical protein